MPVEVPLTRGIVTLVDQADVSRILPFKWQAKRCEYTTYATTSTGMLMHRLIMNDPEGIEIDHKDGNGLNNQRSNLRVASHSQNMWNRHYLRIKNKHGFLGVFWSEQRKGFFGSVACQYRQFVTQKCATAEEAARARDALATQHHGEFAVLNFPNEKKGNSNEQRNMPVRRPLHMPS